MQSITFFVLFSSLIVRICQAGTIIETPKLGELELIEATVNMMQSCYAGRFNTLGLAGVSTGAISKMLVLKEFDTSVIFIDDTSETVNNVTISSVSRYKLQFFVITLANSSTLAKTLNQIKNSIWWNHMATFLLLDWTLSKPECSNVYEILWEAWKMNLLDAKLMCLHRSRGILIYTYNPYTSRAPVPWQVENTYKSVNGHSWTVLVQSYQDTWDRETIASLYYEKKCDTLDFDKTSDLGGYEIPASIVRFDTRSEDSNKESTIVYQIYNITVQTIIDSLNATWKFMVHRSKERLLVNKSGLGYNPIEETQHGISDIAFNFAPHQIGINFQTTYPQFSTGMCIMTQYRGHMSQLSKLVSVLDRTSRFGLLLVSLITLLFFKCFLRKSSILSFLNLVLAVSNAALPKIPNKLAPRIYLGSLFLFALTVQGIYQGKLASLLTKQKPLPNVNNIEDLNRYNYTLHGFKEVAPWINSLDFAGHFIEIDNYNCTPNVLADSKTGCLGEKSHLIDESTKFKLHLSHEMVTTFYGVFVIRSDWPLEKRINTVIKRCFESDLMESMYAIRLRSITNILEFNENIDQDQTFKVLVLENLKFAFVILGVGLGCATVTFIIEIGTS